MLSISASMNLWIVSIGIKSWIRLRVRNEATKIYLQRFLSFERIICELVAYIPPEHPMVSKNTEKTSFVSNFTECILHNSPNLYRADQMNEHGCSNKSKRFQNKRAAYWCLITDWMRSPNSLAKLRIHSIWICINDTSVNQTVRWYGISTNWINYIVFLQYVYYCTRKCAIQRNFDVEKVAIDGYKYGFLNCLILRYEF